MGQRYQDKKIQDTYIHTRIIKTTNTECTCVLGEAKPPIQYVICSSRLSNSHNVIDNLINVTYMFCYAQQFSIIETTRMKFTSTIGGTKRNTVNSIMTSNALDVIVWQPSTDTTNHMTEHMEKWSLTSKQQRGGSNMDPLPS